MKFKLKVLTPTFIGSGETLSPILDFVFERNQITLIDHDKLQDWLYKSKERDIYIKDLTKLAQEGKGNIGRFFIDYKLKLDDFKKISYKLAFSTEGRNDLSKILRRINLPILSGSGAYIPGSTIKGLLRSAFIFKFINDNGGQEKVNISKNILDNYDPRFSYIGEDIFRKDKKRMDTDAMRFIQVTDTNIVPLEKLNVFLLERITRSDSSIPQLILGLSKDTEFELEINILKGLEKSDMPDYWKELFKDERIIIDALHSYMITLMEYEKTLVEKINNSISKSLSIFYSRYISEEKSLEDNKKNSCIVRIGFGKTYYFNSIGYFLTEEEKKKFNIGRYRGRSISIFPSSRWIIRIAEKEVVAPGFCLLYSV